MCPLVFKNRNPRELYKLGSPDNIPNGFINGEPFFIQGRIRHTNSNGGQILNNIIVCLGKCHIAQQLRPWKKPNVDFNYPKEKDNVRNSIIIPWIISAYLGRSLGIFCCV